MDLPNGMDHGKYVNGNVALAEASSPPRSHHYQQKNTHAFSFFLALTWQAKETISRII
jgi:hypothetical protein